MDLDSRIKAYKFVAGASFVFSVVAVLSVCATLPMVYNYVQNVQGHIRHEMRFCEVLYHTLFVRYISNSNIY